MPYVQRDGSNAVCGVYAQRQEGYAEEWLEPDDPEVVAYLNPPAPTPEPHLNNGGLARFSGAAPVEVHENIRLGIVTRIAKGRWRAGLSEAIPSGFSAIPSYVDANPRWVWVSAISPTYVEIRARDPATNLAADCQQIVVKIERVVSE